MDINEIRIPFNKPCLPPQSTELVEEALRSTHLYCDVKFSREAEGLVSKLSGGGGVFLTVSCKGVGTSRGDNLSHQVVVFCDSHTVRK